MLLSYVSSACSLYASVLSSFYLLFFRHRLIYVSLYLSLSLSLSPCLPRYASLCMYAICRCKSVVTCLPESISLSVNSYPCVSLPRRPGSCMRAPPRRSIPARHVSAQTRRLKPYVAFPSQRTICSPVKTNAPLMWWSGRTWQLAAALPLPHKAFRPGWRRQHASRQAGREQRWSRSGGPPS